MPRMFGTGQAQACEVDETHLDPVCLSVHIFDDNNLDTRFATPASTIRTIAAGAISLNQISRPPSILPWPRQRQSLQRCFNTPSLGVIDACWMATAP